MASVRPESRRTLLQETIHQIYGYHVVDHEHARVKDTNIRCISKGRYKMRMNMDVTSGVPYDRLLWKAVSESMSYFSAKPKSTRTGTFLLEIRMLAGLQIQLSSLAYLEAV
jgi:hypothetical protein